MGMMKQLWAAVLLLCAVGAQAEVVAGRDYKVLTQPQPVGGGGRIEVIEFFFYECPHCDHLHDPLATWEKQKPQDVELQMVPVIFRDSLEPLARAYYALETMGEHKRLHKSFFDAIHRQGLTLREETAIADFVAKQGVDREKFSAAYHSFTVSTQVNRSRQMVKDYRVMGTPTIAVDGKYIITGLMPADTIRVLDEVVKLARKERAGKR